MSRRQVTIGSTNCPKEVGIADQSLDYGNYFSALALLVTDLLTLNQA